jgi:hypothetical protein
VGEATDLSLSGGRRMTLEATIGGEGPSRIGAGHAQILVRACGGGNVLVRRRTT